MAIPTHWDTRDPFYARVMVRREMQRRHPDLPEAMLEVCLSCCAADWP